MKSSNNYDKLKKMYYFKKNNWFINLNYKKWIKNFEPKKKELSIQKQYKFDINPFFSIVIPVYNVNIKFFEVLIDSILNQTYSNFEICIADGSPIQNKKIQEIIQKDKRIKYKLLKNNNGISENTNEAIKMSKGDFIAFVDHDDKLAPFALFEIVKKINENRDCDFIYSDEDIIYKNKRYNPHFKPDFSIDTLRSYNYICHFSVIKKELLNKIGLLNKKYDGAQDYDLFLRISENTKNIVHISKILYHWRAHKNSTSSRSSSKVYTNDAGRLALEDHLKRSNLKGIVINEKESGRYRIKYELISNEKVSIIIPNKDCKNDLEKCIDSIMKSTYDNFEIIILENNSVTEEIFEYYNLLKKNKKIKVVKYKINEFNYSKINNFASKYATGKYLLFLNNDTSIITKDWLEEMIGILQRDDVGVVGVKLLYNDNTIQHSGVIIGMGGVAGHIQKDFKDDDPGYFSRAGVINNYSAVTAACMMTKKELFNKVGGFDESLKVAFNDIDFCLKIREKNYLCVYTPYAKLYHYESKSRGYEDTKEKKERFSGEIKYFQNKWKEVLDNGDPFFNKNLSLNSRRFKINYKKRGM